MSRHFNTEREKKNLISRFLIQKQSCLVLFELDDYDVILTCKQKYYVFVFSTASFRRNNLRNNQRQR